MELLERDAPLAQLEALRAGALAGRGALALVGGEAGIGKTSLIRAFLDSLSVDAVLLGACDPLSTPRPLAPLVDIAAASGLPFAAQLATGDRNLIFDAFQADLARSPGTVAVLEDVHWADDATLDLLRFLGRRIERRGALVIATYRDDLPAQHPLRLALGDLVTLPSTRRLLLEPLSVSAISRLCQDTQLDPRSLHSLTSGNPYFAGELLALGHLGLPATVRDAVIARAARLSEAGRAVLSLAAVAGARTEMRLLEHLLPAAAGGCDQCVAEGMLVGHGSWLSFRHELARTAVLESIPPAERLGLERRILDSLRSGVGGEVDAARLAHHAEAADDARAVVEFAGQAGEEAAALRSHHEAAAQFERALRFAGFAPPTQRAQLWERHSYECYLTDQAGVALESRLRALNLWRELGDDLKVGESLRWKSRLLWFLGRNRDAEAAADAAIEVLDRLRPGPQLAMAYSNRAQLRMLAADLPAALKWGRKAVELAERFEAPEVVAHARTNVGTALLISGDQSGRAELERVIEMSVQKGYEEHAARAYCNLISGEIAAGSMINAGARLEEALDYCREHLDSWTAYIEAWESARQLEMGDWNRAGLFATSVLSRPTTPVTDMVASVTIGLLRARRGDPDPWAPLDRALSLALPTGEAQRLGPLRAARAEAAWLGGDLKRCQLEARSGLSELARSSPNWSVGQLAFWSWAATGSAAGDLDLPPTMRKFLAGGVREAADAWAAEGCRYQAALGLCLAGGSEDVRRGLTALERMGAAASVRAVIGHLRGRGPGLPIPRGPRPSTRANPAGLTTRELEILEFLAEGLPNREIASRLHLSKRTVDHHVSAIIGKLGARGRMEAVALGLPGRPSAQATKDRLEMA